MPSSEPPGPEDVVAQHRELERPDEEERERERRRSESQDVTRALIAADTAEPPRAEIDRAADDEVTGDPVDPTCDHGPDRHEQRVVLGVVEQRSCRRGRQNPCNPGQVDEREDRLLTSVDVVLLLVPESDEHRVGTEEDGRHAEPPLPVGIHALSVASRGIVAGCSTMPSRRRRSTRDAVRGDARARDRCGEPRRGPARGSRGRSGSVRPAGSCTAAL